MKKENLKSYPLPENYTLDDFREPILQKIIDRFDFALSQTSQILMVRLDIRYPADLISDGTNDCFQWFWEEYSRKMEKYLLASIWAREQNHSANCHWHIVVLFDANKLKYFGYPFTAIELWKNALKKFYRYEGSAAGLIEVAPQIRNGLRIHRKNQLLIDEGLRISSYIAKKHSKGKAPYHVREFGVSYAK